MSRQRNQIGNEIKRYCAVNPRARDTLDGIAWWLVHQRYHETRTELEAAVEHLVSERVLARQELADGTVLYSCDAREDEKSDEP